MSELEDTFAWQCVAYHLPEPKREWRFMKNRRWRFDFAWPEQKLAVEIQGGTWAKGPQAHGHGRGFTRDCAKSFAAQALGWRVLPLDGDLVRGGDGVRWVQALLSGLVAEDAVEVLVEGVK